MSRANMIDPQPMPEHIPQVQEVGATSAPLTSAAFFIGARCRPFNDDYMHCKNDAQGRGEFDCMREGRKVTRCAASVIQDVNTHCLEEFRNHWHCLENYNHQLWQCRRAERRLNKCVFEKLSLEKTIPDSPEGVTPVHLRRRQIYATLPQDELEDRPWMRWLGYKSPEQVLDQQRLQQETSAAMSEQKQVS